MICKMTKFTLLTHLPCKIKELIFETVSDFKYENTQLIHFFTIDVVKRLKMRYFLEMTILKDLCVQNVSTLIHYPLYCHSILTTIPLEYLT